MEKPHKKLEAWREAVDLTIDIYQATDNLPKEHRFALTNQIHRVTLNVASNIAEGATRQTNKEFANHLHSAQASLSELDTQLEIAKRLKILGQEQCYRLNAQMNHIDKLPSGLIRHLRSQRAADTTPYPLPLTLHR